MLIILGVMAAIFGAGAPLLARRRPILWAALVVLLPPAAIALLYLPDLIAEEWAVIGFSLLGASWIGGSALGAAAGLAIRGRRSRR